MNLLAGLFTMFVVLWFVMFAVPNLLVYLFDTFLGNFILFAFIVMAAMYNVKMALGLAAIFVILFHIYLYYFLICLRLGLVPHLLSKT